MIRWLLLAVGLLSWASLAWGQGVALCPGMKSPLSPASNGFQALAVDGAKAYALTVPVNSQMAVAMPGAAIVYRDDDASPSLTNGMPVAASTLLVLCQNSLQKFQVIAPASTTLNVLFYK